MTETQSPHPPEPCVRCGQPYVLHYFTDTSACGSSRDYVHPRSLRGRWLRWRATADDEGRVLALFASDPHTARFGYDMMRDLRFGAGKLYPILDRLERRGLLEAGFEETDPGVRPPRRWYLLTEQGRAAAQTRPARQR